MVRLPGFIVSVSAIMGTALAAGIVSSAIAETEGFKLTYDPFRDIGEAKTSPADPENKAQTTTGSLLYLEHCAACHGAALEGAENWQDQTDDGSYHPPPHDDSGHTWHHSDKVLFEYTKLGGAELFKDYPDIVSNMPAFEDVLSDEDIWAIFAFIKSSWSEENRNWQINASKLDPVPDAYLLDGDGTSQSTPEND